MGASESGVVNGGDMETVVQLPDPDEEIDEEDQKFHSSLSKKNSILSLTLEEIQFRSRKSFGSMNMDEFLASVWRAEDNQPLTSQTESNNNNGDSREGSAPTGKSVLTKQGSFSIPTPLCNKTVDEVWYEIHKDDNHHHRQPLDANNLELPPHSQQTFGEMTLEDFLFKAGVMQEEQMQSPTAPTQKQTVVGFSDTVTPYMSEFTNNGLSGNGYVAAAYQICGQNSNRHMGEVVSLKNRRIVGGPLEVVVERRQRRMIKNRESALRGHLVSMVELAKLIINYYLDIFRVIILMPSSSSSPDTTTAATTSYIYAAAASLPPPPPANCQHLLSRLFHKSRHPHHRLRPTPEK